MLLSKLVGQVALPVKDADQLNASRRGAIEDDVFPHRKASQSRAKFRPGDAEKRELSKQSDFFVEGAKLSVGDGFAGIGGEIVPDFQVVSL